MLPTSRSSRSLYGVTDPPYSLPGKGKGKDNLFAVDGTITALAACAADTMTPR